MDDLDSTNNSDQLLDWFGAHFSADSPFCWGNDDPYNLGDITSLNEYLAWDPSNEEDQFQFLPDNANSINSTNITSIDNPSLAVQPDYSPSPTSGTSKKRKSVDNPVTKLRHTLKGKSPSQEKVVDQEAVSVKKQNGSKKKPCRSNVNSNNCNNGKDGRWAEQLLNPCAAAIMAGNLTRVQHLLLVLRELGSAAGDPNYRLALHGLKALTHHISPTPSSSISTFSFASTEPKLFQRSLLKFYEVSPWFIFPNTIGNFSILQILAQGKNSSQNLHILDIGVSHGIQWPTLLEALSKQPGGPPPVIRITVVTATVESEHTLQSPFSVGPPGHRFSTSLLSFGKSLNINLEINHIDNFPLQNLNSQVINSSENETLIVSAHFRLHSLNHNMGSDERSEVLKALRNLNPKGLILSENDTDCSCINCADFATGFSKKVEYLWKFLDSTSSAYKGRECDERRVLEGEAAKALVHISEMNEGKEKWCERMRKGGFIEEVFDEDVVDAGKALLRKYDSNWEMRVGEKDGCVGICWKGQPVSFCSLWKVNTVDIQMP